MVVVVVAEGEICYPGREYGGAVIVWLREVAIRVSVYSTPYSVRFGGCILGYYHLVVNGLAIIGYIN